MLDWMRRLLPHREQAAEADPAEAPGSDAVSHERDAAILEAIQKASRAQARLSARVEAIETKLEGGFTDLRATIEASASTGPSRASTRWDDLLDAVDLLDEAIRSIAGTEGREAVHGLRGIASRLDRFLAQTGLVRVIAPERLTDGRLFRVVGTEQRPELADGAVARLVRAAVLDGDRVLREGEVIVNRRDS